MHRTRRLTQFFAVSAFMAAAVLPTGNSPAEATYFPTGYGRMDSGMSGGVMDDNSPFAWAGARMHRAYENARMLERLNGTEQKVEAEAYQGMLDGTYAPVVRYSDGTANVAALLAQKFAKAGTTKMSQPDMETFLNAREADFERDMSVENLPARSLTSSCAYWVDSLYSVGAGIHSSPSDREQMRATCALTIGKTEKLGQLATNEQRYTIGRAVAMIAATFRNLATQPNQRADAVAGARAMFKSNFGYAIDSVPVGRFPCVLSESNMSDCDVIMTRYAARLPEIARRNT